MSTDENGGNGKARLRAAEIAQHEAELARWETLFGKLADIQVAVQRNRSGPCEAGSTIHAEVRSLSDRLGSVRTDTTWGKVQFVAGKVSVVGNVFAVIALVFSLVLAARIGGVGLDKLRVIARVLSAETQLISAPMPQRADELQIILSNKVASVGGQRLIGEVPK